jgi:hypothetical protein
VNALSAGTGTDSSISNTCAPQKLDSLVDLPMEGN